MTCMCQYAVHTSMYAHILLNNVDPNEKIEKTRGSRGTEGWVGKRDAWLGMIEPSND